MARMKQTACKSTRGRAPRRFPYESSFYTFNGHAGKSVTTVYSCDGLKNSVSRLSLPLYTISTLKESAQELCQLFLQLHGISRWGNVRNNYHRREKEFRKNSGGPHFAPNWSKRGSYGYRAYRNVIFVVDQRCEDWPMVLMKGLLSVQFDLDNRPEDQFEVLEAEELDDPRDEGLVEINPVLDDPSIEIVVVGHEQEDEIW